MIFWQFKLHIVYIYILIYIPLYVPGQGIQIASATSMFVCTRCSALCALRTVGHFSPFLLAAIHAGRLLMLLIWLG